VITADEIISVLRQRRQRIAEPRYRLAVFFAVLGPASSPPWSITTRRHHHLFPAGARWGYLPLWTLLPITIVLIMTQEMCSRWAL
jgi:hypothetical protein